MIKHMFKLIWNRKRSSFLMMLEITLSFIVLFAIGSMILYATNNYTKPLGFSYKNVYVLRMDWNNVMGGHIDADTPSDSLLRETLMVLEREMLSFDEVECVTPTSEGFPYSLTNIMGNLSTEVGRTPTMFPYDCGDDYDRVLGLTVSEGRWFGPEDDASTLAPLVINRPMREAMFGDGPAVGETMLGEWNVVGVIDTYRFYGEIEEPGPAMFFRENLNKFGGRAPRQFLFSVRPGTGIDFEERLIDRLHKVAPGWTMGVERMEDLREFYFSTKRLPIIIFGVVAGFLIINVALGLFGVLWYSINRRRGEIGLRRAIGANSPQVSLQILGEALVATTFGLALGIFFAIQAPLLGLFGAVETSVYAIAILCSVLVIYLIVAVCALYPSRLAARIHPAVALHNE